MSAALESTRDGKIYEVFAKYRADDPLGHVGSVVAPDGELAKVYARSLYNEWDWSGMMVVAREDIVRVVDPA